MQNILKSLTVLCVSLGFATTAYANAQEKDLAEVVAATERAFAKTMADRDFEAFKSFLDSETIFWNGTTGAMRGADAVAQEWRNYYMGDDAPFSWEPDEVQVLDSGGLALSTGPVYSASGQVIARFQSIWRLNAAGEWKIIFDKGGPFTPKAGGN